MSVDTLKSTKLRRRDPRQGFVLVIVVWGIGVISLLALSVIRSADIQGTLASNDLESARAEALAEAGVNLGILHLLTYRQAGLDAAANSNGQPTFCRTKEGVAALDIEDEGGKVDLNAAPQNLLAALFYGAGASKDQARSLSAAVATFRSSSNDASFSEGALSDDHHSLPPKRALFETVYELQQVRGMTAALFQAVAPFVTVHSRSAAIDGRFASSQLIAMLSVGAASQTADLGLPPEFAGSSDQRTFVVRAEILGSHGAEFVREALVEFASDDPRRLLIREWRKGPKRFASELARLSQASALPWC